METGVLGTEVMHTRHEIDQIDTSYPGTEDLDMESKTSPWKGNRRKGGGVVTYTLYFVQSTEYLYEGAQYSDKP
ncbi:hypothetical protein BPOR_1308g00010 [Botrytis porri]|uniref:Uncharacterized protein n=1 Tax=Botrytis porri TaxID=87229 RepID=A0A4Z1KAI5_9HELO|nr:hypothetical protein BPOR_1308g00010 [Botrytis porri]